MVCTRRGTTPGSQASRRQVGSFRRRSSSARACARTGPAAILSRCNYSPLNAGRTARRTLLFPVTTTEGRRPHGAEKRQNPSCGSRSLGDFLPPDLVRRRPRCPVRMLRVYLRVEIASLLTSPCGFDFDFFTGVACSLVPRTSTRCSDGSASAVVAAVREDAPVGLAAGAWSRAAGRFVLMQNSRGPRHSLQTRSRRCAEYGLPCWSRDLARP